MKKTNVGKRPRAALCVSAAAALLVACGGGQPSPDAAAESTRATIQAVPISRTGWVAVAQPNDVLMQNLAIPADAPTRGMWSGVGAWPMNGLHQAVLPDGRVLTWGTTPDGNTQNGRYFDVWDPNRGLFDAGAHNLTFDANRQDSFCAPSVWLGDGRLMMTGGNANFGGQTYAPANGAFAAAPNLADQRWYATMLTLADGRPIVVGGIDPYTEGQWTNPAAAVTNGQSSMTPEVYENGAWRSLLNAQSRTAFGPDNLRASLPKAWLAPDGRVFGIGTDQMYYVDANAAGGQGTTTIVGTYKAPPNAAANGETALNVGPTMSGVMYAPGKVLTVGGNSYQNGSGNAGSRKATSIDLNGGGAVLTEQAPMANVRNFANTIVLPNGRVLVTGGETLARNDPAFGVFAAEQWDPATGAWSTLASAAVFRGYHSQTSLLTNGTVLSSGGGTPGPIQLKGEVFYPPYLFRTANGAAQLAPRPQLIGISGLKHAHGAQMQFDLSNNNTISQVVLIGLSVGTHSFNAGQRRIPMGFTQDTFRITATVPGANLVPPGYYQVVAVDANGVPSRGTIVAIGGAVNAPPVVTTAYTPPDTAGGGVTPPPGPTPPASAVACAAENGTCTLPAGTTATVWYGAGTLWARQTGITGSLACSNATFGDPAPGVVKSCVYEVTSTTPPATGPQGENLAPSATLATSYVSPWETLAAVNNNIAPANSADKTGGAYGNWQGDALYGRTDWVSFSWGSERRLNALDVYWWNDGLGIATPTSARVEYWNGSAWASLGSPGLALNTFNRLTFAPVTTTSIRVSMASTRATGILEVRVWGDSLALPSIAAPIIPAGGTATYMVAATAGVTYSWNFGDGSAPTAFSATASATKVFANAGVYGGTLTARGSDGTTATRSFLQAVTASATANRPTASSAVALETRAGASARLWVANPDNDSVGVIDIATNARVAEIGVGRSPRSVAIAGDGRVWVVNKDSATISIASPATLAVVQTVTLPAGSRPHGLAFAPGGSAFVALEGTGELLKLDPVSGAVQARLAVGANPRHVSASADGALVLLSRFITNPLPGEGSAAVDTTTAGAEVVAVNAGPMTANKTIVLRHSDKVDNENQGAGIPNYLAAAVISPDGKSAWVPSKQDNIKRGTLRNTQPLNFQNSVRAISSRIDMPTLAEDYARRVDHDNSSLGSAAAYHPSGAYLFVALETSRQVAIVDAVGGRELLKVDVGRAPQGVAVSADGTRLFVQNFMDRTVSVLDLGPLNQGQLNLPAAATVASLATERLSAPVLQGKQLFYDARDPRLARDSYMSCASCHNDAGHDGRTWDFTGFGEGLRNTPALKGRAGAAQGFVHWSANFDEIQDFEGQIRAFAGGTGLMPDAQFNTGTRNTPLGDKKAGVSADLDALAAYLGSLNAFDASPGRNADGTLTAAAAAGKTVFTNANCASCHGGAGFTGSGDATALKNIGTIKPTSGLRLNSTLTGIDIPTLRDVWQTAPYLHDGSAPTLAAAVQAHAGNTVAGTDLANLVAYLQQIGSQEAAPSAPANLPPATAVNCAAEGATCTPPAGSTATVWYGAGTTWVQKAGVTGSIACTNATFGDPLPGTVKSCRYELTSTTPPPTTGTGTGLAGSYFNNTTLSGAPVLTRTEAPFFDWGVGAPATGVAADNFSVRWTGQVQAIEAGTYQFRTNSDDGVRVWVNGVLVINNWTAHAPTLDTSAGITLAAGQRAAIVVEFQEFGGGALLQLSWLRPGGAWAPVPATQLYPAAATGTGLAASYFANTALTGTPVLTRVEAPWFDWGVGAPAAGVPADNFSVRWTGQVQAIEGGSYQFRTNSDDGVRVWVNGVLVINNWTVHAPMVDTSAGITLAAGQRAAIVVEFQEFGGGAVLQLGWLRPGGVWAQVPAAQLFTGP